MANKQKWHSLAQASRELGHGRNYVSAWLSRHREEFPEELMLGSGKSINASGNDILFADESNHYLMLEFPDDDVPAYTDKMIYDLQQRGIIPVIVHPERNTKIMRQPDILFDLLQKGCLSQLTASSYVGTFGKQVEAFCQQLLAAGQGYVFSSDAHNLPGRKYQMREAFDKLSKEFGTDVADAFEGNAKAIINGDVVLTHSMEPVVKKRKWFKLF